MDLTCTGQLGPAAYAAHPDCSCPLVEAGICQACPDEGCRRGIVVLNDESHIRQAGKQSQLLQAANWTLNHFWKSTAMLSKQIMLLR